LTKVKSKWTSYTKPTHLSTTKIQQKQIKIKIMLIVNLQLFKLSLIIFIMGHF